MTTLTANFALALASESGARVAVVDMDFQLGEIALGLGLTGDLFGSGRTQEHRLTDYDEFLATTFDSALRQGLSVLASPEDYSFFQLSSHESVTRLFRVLREEFDYVVVDARRVPGTLFRKRFLEMCDRSLHRY